jgi:hypothetical protein
MACLPATIAAADHLQPLAGKATFPMMGVFAEG